MTLPQQYLEENYGRFEPESQALIDLVVRLLQRVDALEAQVQRLRKDVNE